MDILSSLVNSLTPEQRVTLQTLLLSHAAPTGTMSAPAPVAATPASKGLDLSNAIEVKFRATLSPNDRCRDPEWAQTYDHVWFKGHYQVKGPKGGLYCHGRAVLGNAQKQQYKGVLKISNKAFLQLQQGQAIDGWFIPDDTKDNVFVGTLSDFQPLK